MPERSERNVYNNVGKLCVRQINDEYVSTFRAEKEKIKFIDPISLIFDFPTNTTEHENNQSNISESIRIYLKNAKEKYIMVKTLLYNDQPKPFYDFYVCNDIERNVQIQGRYSTTNKNKVIENVSVKDLVEISHFSILSGTGGLGKSMMMRHLLLNSLVNFEKLHIVPIFIPLKDFDETVVNLIDYIFSRIQSLNIMIYEHEIHDLFNTGKCIFLFDGLDEIGSNYAKKFERELVDFIDKYTGNYFVISSRPFQSFISYSRFTIFELKPFSKNQALKLIDNLEFRQDEPIIKYKFRTALNENLFSTHGAFIKNPLLLTIMLLTFEQYAEVPSKMHIFYREAYSALSVKHDANKGAYKRTLKTGLSTDKFADYFAEICSRSYHDEKFELTEGEFENYYDVLKEREKCSDKITTASDYLYDLCSNLCLMYFESGKYHFTHRSFQEYFCALYFSKQKDKNLENIGEFFENRRIRMSGDKTFNMLYDMIPDKIDEYIFIPFLSQIYKQCDSEKGYWTFLELMYPYLNYEIGETCEWVLNSSESYLYNFLKELNGLWYIECHDFPPYNEFLKTEYVSVLDLNGSQTVVDKSKVNSEYLYEYGLPDTVGWAYEFDMKVVLQQPERYMDLIDRLNDDKFEIKQEYSEMQKYLNKLKSKLKPTGNSLFDLF